MTDEFGTFQDLKADIKDKLRGGKGPRPTGPQRKYRKKPKQHKKAFRKSTPTQEAKYQAIRAYNSNLISLSDLRALFVVTATVAEKEYTNPRQQEMVLRTRDRLEKIARLTETRNEAKLRYELKSKKKAKLPSTRAETIAQFVSGYEGKVPYSWDRFGPLVAKSGRQSAPRDGSSKGKIANPRYIGFNKFNRDFDELAKAIVKLLEIDDRNRKKARSMLGKVGKSTNVTTRRGG